MVSIRRAEMPSALARRTTVSGLARALPFAIREMVALSTSREHGRGVIPETALGEQILESHSYTLPV